MSQFVWVSFLAMVGILAMVYMPLEYASYEIQSVVNTTTTHVGALQTNAYIATVWYFLPIIFLVMFAYWAFAQSQKREV